MVLRVPKASDGAQELWRHTERPYRRQYCWSNQRPVSAMRAPPPVHLHRVEWTTCAGATGAVDRAVDRTRVTIILLERISAGERDGCPQRRSCWHPVAQAITQIYDVAAVNDRPFEVPLYCLTSMGHNATEATMRSVGTVTVQFEVQIQTHTTANLTDTASTHRKGEGRADGVPVAPRETPSDRLYRLAKIAEATERWNRQCTASPLAGFEGLHAAYWVSIGCLGAFHPTDGPSSAVAPPLMHLRGVLEPSAVFCTHSAMHYERRWVDTVDSIVVLVRALATLCGVSDAHSTLPEELQQKHPTDFAAWLASACSAHVFANAPYAADDVRSDTIWPPDMPVVFGVADDCDGAALGCFRLLVDHLSSSDVLEAFTVQKALEAAVESWPSVGVTAAGGGQRPAVVDHRPWSTRVSMLRSVARLFETHTLAVVFVAQIARGGRYRHGPSGHLVALCVPVSLLCGAVRDGLGVLQEKRGNDSVFSLNDQNPASSKAVSAVGEDFLKKFGADGEVDGATMRAHLLEATALRLDRRLHPHADRSADHPAQPTRDVWGEWSKACRETLNTKENKCGPAEPFNHACWALGQLDQYRVLPSPAVGPDSGSRSYAAHLHTREASILLGSKNAQSGNVTPAPALERLCDGTPWVATEGVADTIVGICIPRGPPDDATRSASALEASAERARQLGELGARRCSGSEAGPDRPSGCHVPTREFGKSPNSHAPPTTVVVVAVPAYVLPSSHERGLFLESIGFIYERRPSGYNVWIRVEQAVAYTVVTIAISS